METSNHEFIVLVEAQDDYETATGIAEKVIKEKAPIWLIEILEYNSSLVFSWTGFETNTFFSRWCDIFKIEKQFENDGYRPSRFLGHSDPYERIDYPIARKVVLLILYLNSKKKRNIRAVLLIRDADNQRKERLASLHHLRDSSKNSLLQIIIGMAEPEREAWVLNGFVPQTNDEKEILQKIRKEVNFDPCIDAHRLRGKISQPGTETRDIKQVLCLLGIDPLREKLCWQVTPLSTLVERGGKTGLSDFIDEVSNFLLPILTQQ